MEFWIATLTKAAVVLCVFAGFAWIAARRRSATRSAPPPADAPVAEGDQPRSAPAHQATTNEPARPFLRLSRVLGPGYTLSRRTRTVRRPPDWSPTPGAVFQDTVISEDDVRTLGDLERHYRLPDGFVYGITWDEQPVVVRETDRAIFSFTLEEGYLTFDLQERGNFRTTEVARR